MPKTKITADELIWLFHEGLAGTNFPNARIAIVPGADGRWTALTSAGQRKRHPTLARDVVRIEKQLQAQYSLKQS